jgi:thioredoxin-dependent peroxiredoxin
MIPMPLPSVGSPAPDFALPDQEGKVRALSSEKGKWVLIYFYPKDDTPGCTMQACAIRDDYPEFEKLGITVFGISADSVKSHAKFSEKYDLPFTILADEEKKTLSDYGVWQSKTFMGRTYMGIVRTSFLIDPKGKIAKVYENVKARAHAEMVLRDLKELAK